MIGLEGGEEGILAKKGVVGIFFSRALFRSASGFTNSGEQCFYKLSHSPNILKCRENSFVAIFFVGQSKFRLQGQGKSAHFPVGRTP